MRKFNFLFAALAIFVLAGPAFAIRPVNQDHTCQGGHNCNEGGSSADASATAVGVGVGIGFGQGGNGGNASATGGSATSGSISGAGVFGSGNSSNEIGTGIGNFSPTSSSSVGPISNSQGQGQEQTAVGKVRTDVNVEGSTLIAEGDEINYEAPEIPVNSAAPVFAGACSQGVSVQTQSFGASAGSTNPVCDYVAVAGGLVASGERGEALRVLGKAEKAADFRYNIYRIRAILTLGLL